MTTPEASEDLLRRTLRVVVPAADMAARLDAKIEEVRGKVNLKGFRPGKVPASHIRKVYGPSIMREVVDETLQQRSGAALSEASVRAVGEPRLELQSDINAVLAGGVDLAFTLEVDVMPEFTPPEPREITLEKPVAPVSEDQIQSTLTQIAEANRAYEDRDGPAESGDVLTIDFIGRIDGEAFEGGSAEGATLTLGSNQFIPGFEDQLIGVRADEQRTIAVTFPEDYGAAHLAGKAAEFEVKVSAVRAPQEAVADDALATRLGLGGLSDLTDAVRKRLEQDHAALSRAKVKRALFDQLDKALDFPLPKTMVEAEFDQIWRQVSDERAAGRGDAEDEGKSDEELQAGYRRIAERRVRLGLALAEIGNRGGVVVRDEEVAAAMNEQARRFPGQERQVIEFYRRNPGALAQLRAPIYEEKVVDFILELAQVSERPATREELLEDDPPLD